MKRMIHLSIVAGLALLAAGAAAPAAEKPAATRLLQARTAARGNAATPEGKDWLKSHANAVGAAMIPILNTCLADDGEELTAFSIFVRLTKEGRVAEVVTELDASLGTCMTAGAQATQLPSPPRDDYWMQLNLAADL